MIELRYDGRVAIVTGAGRGIGRSYALLLASRGAKVVVNDLGGGPLGGGKSRDAAEETVAEIVAAGGEAVADFSDVSSENEARVLVNRAIESYGRIDIVINNAGIQGYVPFAEMTLDQFDLMQRVHTRGTFMVTRAAWPHLIKQGYGRVVMTCSGVMFGMKLQAHYSSAKGGIFSLMRVLSLEGEQYGINVNTIIPGALTRLFLTAPPMEELTNMPTFEPVKPLPDNSRENNIGSASEQVASAGLSLSSDLVAPAVGWLVHESCNLNGEALSVAAGHVARVFVGVTPGFFSQELTVESIRDNWPEIQNEAGYFVVHDIHDFTHALESRAGIRFGG